MENSQEPESIDTKLWAHVMNILDTEGVKPSTHSTSRSFSAIQAKLQEIGKDKLNEVIIEFEEKHNI